MLRKTFFLIIFSCSLLTSFGQKKSYIFMGNMGIGYADRTTCFAKGSYFTYQVLKNRISFGFLEASKKRTEYSNGDYEDALITNLTVKYSRNLSLKSFSFLPELGLGLVSGNWTKNSNDNTEQLQIGLGLEVGFGLEYCLKNHLILRMGYNQGLHFRSLTGNSSILFGVGWKCFKEDNK